MKDNYLYQQSEKVGRKKVFDCIKNNNLKFEDLKAIENNDYSRWDIEAKMFNQKLNKYVFFNIECKNRACTSTRFSDIKFNYDKFIANVMAAKKQGKIAIFAATYADNKCRFWNLTALYNQKKFWKTMDWMPVSTVEDRGYEWKDQVHLKNEDAFNEYAIYKKTA